MPSRVLYFSRRAWLLRAVSALLLGQIVLVVWLLSLAPRAQWSEALGERFWWIVPAALLALSMIVPAAMAWLISRYVLRLEATPEGVTVTTFRLWGRQTRTFSRAELRNALTSSAPTDSWREFTHVSASALRVRLPRLKLDLLFDRQGEFPEGEAAVQALFESRVDAPR